jgi:TrmH family RNA methyltransferase
MITSPRNPKLTLARKLRRRRWREREGMFVTEGEDLLAAGRAAGIDPVAILSSAGSGLGGLEVSQEALDSAAALGSGTRALVIWSIPAPPAPARWGPLCAYLHEVADPGNVGAIVRSADALLGARVVLGPGCADPYGPKATRATMGAIFARPPVHGELGDTPEPRLALSAHGGRPLSDLSALLGGPDATRSLTLCLGAERAGLPAEVVSRCLAELTIRLRTGAESLNVAAAAAIALHRISSAGFGERERMEDGGEMSSGSGHAPAAIPSAEEGLRDA